MTDNNLRDLKVCLEKLGLRVSFTSDLSVGYLRFPEGDGQISRYTNKTGDYLVVIYPGNPNGYYLNGQISEIAEWIIAHRDRLLWKKVEISDDQTKEILKIRDTASIYQTTAGKWHISFNNTDDMETAARYLHAISDELAEKYSLQKSNKPITEVISPNVFLYGENGIKFEIIKELVHNNYPRKSQYDKNILIEEYATAEGILWAKKFVLPEAFPSNKKIDFIFPVATKLLAEDEIVVRVHSFEMNRTQNRITENRRKSKSIDLPTIPIIQYIEIPENIEITKRAKLLCKKLYNPKSPISLDERNEIVQSLWDMANKGSLKATELLAESLGMTMIKSNDSWPIYISDPIGMFLAKEKVLNLGGYPYSLYLHFVNDFPEYQPSKENLTALVNIGSGLAAIVNADILVVKRGRIEVIKDLYKLAALKGYSVGWRALYCICKYENNEDAAKEALKQFYELAPKDHTNWGRLESECVSHFEGVSINRVSFSLRSSDPKKAVSYLKRSRGK